MHADLEVLSEIQTNDVVAASTLLPQGDDNCDVNGGSMSLLSMERKFVGLRRGLNF